MLMFLINWHSLSNFLVLICLILCLIQIVEVGELWLMSG
jgi:hypothetical protein